VYIVDRVQIVDSVQCAVYSAVRGDGVYSVQRQRAACPQRPRSLTHCDRDSDSVRRTRDRRDSSSPTKNRRRPRPPGSVTCPVRSARFRRRRTVALPRLPRCLRCSPDRAVPCHRASCIAAPLRHSATPHTATPHQPSGSVPPPVTAVTDCHNHCRRPTPCSTPSTPTSHFTSIGFMAHGGGHSRSRSHVMDPWTVAL